MKIIIIPILLITLLLTGCSSTPQKNKSFFTQEQQIELREIVDSYLTEQDWEKIQQKLDDVKKLIDHNIDIKNDYDKDPMVLMSLSQYPHDNPNFQKELSEFLHRYLLSSPEMQKMRDRAKGGKFSLLQMKLNAKWSRNLEKKTKTPLSPKSG